MTLPTIPGVVRAAVRGVMPNGRYWTNVVHCRYAGGASTPGHTEIDALDAKLLRLWSGAAYTSGGAWLTQCLNTVSLLDITYYNLDAISTAYIKNHPLAGGLVPGGSEPNEVAHVLTLRTAARGRRNRGRIYFPAVSVLKLQATGNLLQSVADLTVAQITGLITDLASIQWAIGVASYGVSHNRGAHNFYGAASLVTWTPAFQEATYATMDLRPDVQRRRK